MAHDSKEARQEDRSDERDEKQAENEQIRDAKTEAYLELSEQIEAFEAEKDALLAQFTTGTIPEEAQRIIGQIDEQIAGLTRERNLIDYSTAGLIVLRTRKEKLKDIVQGTNRAAEGSAGAREQVTELKNETLALPAQNLLEAGLLPSDLKGGERMATAARLIGHPNATAEELSALADQIQPYFDVEFSLKEASEEREKGVVIGRTTDTIKEIVKNPAKLGGAALGLFGAWLLWSAVGSTPSDGAKKWIKGILGVAGIGVGLGVATGAFSRKNVGLGDALETMTGLRADEAFSSPEMDKVRRFFESMPTSDTDAVDDFIRIVDAPIENVADMFDAAVRSGERTVDSSRLLGNGLSSKESPFIDEGSLYTANEWFFMEVYKRGLAEGQIPVSNDKKSQLTAAVAYARTRFKGHKMGTCLAAMEILRLNAPGEAAPVNVDASIKDPNLAALARENPAFKRVLRHTSRPNVFLLNGYPVRYHFTDTGDHVFEDVIDGTYKFVLVDAALRGDSLEYTLARISKEAERRARVLLEVDYPAYKNRFKYRADSADGYWELDPKEARITHAGLPNYAKDKAVEMVFLYDAETGKARPGLDSDQDGKVDPLYGDRNTPYTKVDADKVKEDFEKPLLHARVTADINRTLLVQFTVTNFENVDTETKVYIQYGTAKGEVIYENDKIKSYTLGSDAALEAAWTAAANVKQKDFLGDERVQAALLRATTAYTGYNPGLMAGLVDKFLGLTKDGWDWLKSDSVTNEFESVWEEQVMRKMTDLIYDPVNGFSKLYVDSIFRTHKANGKPFQDTEDAFMNARIDDLEGSGVLMAKLEPEKTPDMALTLEALTREINEKGRSRIEIALAPLRNQTPTASSSVSWTVVNGVYNFVMNDAPRTAYFDQKVSEYMQELTANLTDLATPVTRDQLEAEIVKMEKKAMKEAVEYWGTTDAVALEKMMISPNVKGTLWEEPSKMLANYLANNFKWEKYGILPKPENMMIIMKTWYEKIGDPRAIGLTDESVKSYAEYFISEVWICFGGNKDYSLANFYTDKIGSVSDSQFAAKRTGFEANLKNYGVWEKPANLELRPPVLGMEDSLDQAKPIFEKEMREWFEKQNDISCWERMSEWKLAMVPWREVYKASFDRRLADILSKSTDVGVLQTDLAEYKKFLIIEQKWIYEPLIMNGTEPKTDYIGTVLPSSVYVETHIIKEWRKYFDAKPRDLDGYKKAIKANMADILDSEYPLPDPWGIPILP